ncbi:MAG TPA: hypothetical protein PL092_02445, partial [Candidatus Pacearchaeota archaeon]|nr:hypothetical protein [Candidatus Pacearchaeota archaeon]
MTEYILLGISLFLILLIVFLIKRNKKRKIIEQALKLTLFSVKMSGVTAEEIRDSQKQEKDWIRLMEDFYSSLNSLSKEGLFGIDPWIALEIVKLK